MGEGHWSYRLGGRGLFPWFFGSGGPPAGQGAGRGLVGQVGGTRGEDQVTGIWQGAGSVLWVKLGPIGSHYPFFSPT